MSYLERKVVYFRNAGKENTNTLLKIAKEYAEKEDIEDIVVASTTGETGAKAAKIFKGCNVVVVTHHVGFQKPGETELKEEFKKEILNNGGKIFTGTHALSSVERAMRRILEPSNPLNLSRMSLDLWVKEQKCVWK